MDPGTLLTIGKTLLDAGPAMIRGIGNLFGGKTAEVVNTAANIVESVRGAKDPETVLADRLKGLPAEDLVELEKVTGEIKVELAKVEERREENRLNAETQRHNQSQETIRTEAVHGTDYVKETRPKMARMSGWAMVIYVLVAEVANMISTAWGGADLGGANVALAGMLFTPCGTYMTMRTFDGFTKKGRS